jgi:hypothetical protein
VDSPLDFRAVGLVWRELRALETPRGRASKTPGERAPEAPEGRASGTPVGRTPGTSRGCVRAPEATLVCAERAIKSPVEGLRACGTPGEGCILVGGTQRVQFAVNETVWDRLESGGGLETSCESQADAVAGLALPHSNCLWPDALHLPQTCRRRQSLPDSSLILQPVGRFQL